MNNYNGTLVSIEGIDKSGKSTLIENLREEYEDATFTREPSDGYYGKRLRKIIEDPSSPRNGLPDFFMFLADRADHINQVIRPDLQRGRTVFCDRYYDSTLAYQSHEIRRDIMSGEDPLLFGNKMMDDWAIEPDLTIYIDIPVKTALRRKSLDGDEDYQKFEDKMNLGEARDKYLTLAEAYSDRFVVIDGKQHPDQVFEEAMESIEE